MRRAATLYLHFPCFDGLVSAVLASDFLEQQGWSFDDRFYPVNYDLKRAWLSKSLETPSAVVDFLYHPDAQFWADHHSTTFLSEELRLRYDDRKAAWSHYDVEASSCALLLWNRFNGWFDSRRVIYQEMVAWADKIDAARYVDVKEAILGDAPALKIYRSLIASSDPEYCVFLVQALRKKSLNRVAQLKRISRKSEDIRSLMEIGLKRFRKFAHLNSGDIVVFDLEATSTDIISRYSPFFFYPEARYSVGITRRDGTAKITAMRNPWVDFESAPLGTIFARYGGGGHQRVASIILREEDSLNPETTLSELVSEIQRQDSAHSQPIHRAFA